ncbi:MAG: hypothetical protein IH586_23925, partial [Anaerolineaceae bacterium]|nr:hypothetical protein [Anaerolineaceae bacterium]
MRKKNRYKGRGRDLNSVNVDPAADVRVLYIHPAKQGVELNYDDKAGRAYGVIPVGLPALVNLLIDNGIEVQGISYPLERQLNPSFHLESWC